MTKNIKIFILATIIVLLVILGASFFILKKKFQEGDINSDIIGRYPFLFPKFNFNYSDGEKNWLTHINTDINTTYESLISTSDYVRNLQCAGDVTDVGKAPFAFARAVCFQGNGAKMIVPMLGDEPPYAVFISPPSGGLFEQAGGMPNHFFHPKSLISTKFFVVPLNDYEVPTYYPNESAVYLPIWKQVFQQLNSMDDNYFNSHIFVTGTTVDNYLDDNGKMEKKFNVTYYYQVDWAQEKLNDGFTYSYEGIGEGITSEELWRDINITINQGKSVSLNQSKYKKQIHINILNPVNQIASKTEIKKAVEKASSLLRFNVNGIKLNFDGQLISSLSGVIDYKANRCLVGTINIENANVTEVVETNCRLEAK